MGPEADPRFAQHCRPGERLLASAGVRYVAAHEDLGHPAGSWGEEAASFALQRGRLRVDLADSSTVMVLTGMLATRSARRLAGAW